MEKRTKKGIATAVAALGAFITVTGVVGTVSFAADGTWKSLSMTLVAILGAIVMAAGLEAIDTIK